jgi:hypothetical protein
MPFAIGKGPRGLTIAVQLGISVESVNMDQAKRLAMIDIQQRSHHRYQREAQVPHADAQMWLTVA